MGEKAGWRAFGEKKKKKAFGKTVTKQRIEAKGKRIGYAICLMLNSRAMACGI